MISIGKVFELTSTPLGISPFILKIILSFKSETTKPKSFGFETISSFKTK